MILGTLNAVLVVKMTPEGGEIDVRVIYEIAVTVYLLWRH